MKILLVASYLPYPLYSGGHIRLYNLMKQLSKKHKITLICERRQTQTDEDVAQITKVCERVVTVPRSKQWTAQNILKSGYSTKPFLIIGHTSQQMQQAIRHELNETQFDLIHVETFYVMQNLPKTYLPIVLAEHNIEYLVYRRYLETAPFYLRPMLFIDIEKLKRIEQFYWKKATHVVAVSDEEKHIMGLDEKTTVVPNGVDIEKFKVKREKYAVEGKKKILFIGDFKWIQNRDAALWIIKEIWPLIKEKNVKRKIDLQLWIVGKNMPEELKNLAADDIMLDEDAPSDTTKIFKAADLLLAPKRVGGGTSYKILEAMASGTPVVTTTLGIEGLKVKEDSDILVSDDPEELAQKTMLVLTNTKKYETLTESARAIVEKYYTWESIAATLDAVYEEVSQT